MQRLHTQRQHLECLRQHQLMYSQQHCVQEDRTFAAHLQSKTPSLTLCYLGCIAKAVLQIPLLCKAAG